MAVRLEWAHAQCLGEGERLAIVNFGWLDVRRFSSCATLTQESQGTRLIAAFLVRLGEGEGALAQLLRLLQTTRQQLRLTQLDAPWRDIGSFPLRDDLLHALLPQGRALGEAPA